MRDAYEQAVVQSAQRDAVIRIGDQRVAAGARISLQAIAGLRERCGAECTVVVVLIPTKELVFEPEVEASGVEVPTAYRALVANEKELWRFLRAGLEAEGIACVDVLESLQASVAAERNPYLCDWNGHLNPTGNQVVADRVAEHEALLALKRD